MRQLSYATGLVLSIFLLGGAAQATSFAPNVDFRESAFQPSGAVSSFSATSHGYHVTIETLKLTGGGLVSNGRLYWNDEDGYGIIGAGYENDEIELPEVLRISFGSSTYIESALVSDLYLERKYAETGKYSLDGGSSWTWFQADGQHSNGEVSIPLSVWADAILFTAPGKIGKQTHEFSVAGLELGRGYSAAAPEPGAALLFGVGLALVGRRASRRS